MSGTGRFIMICTGRSLSGACPDRGIPDGDRSAYARCLSASLARVGHKVEIWTVQLDDRPPVERLAEGVLVRRFRGQRDYLVPSVRPCGWVAEWVACASEELAGMPGRVVTLVTHEWEPGVAGRRLVERFGFAHVHVPHALDPAAGDQGRREGAELESAWCIARRVEEDRQTCHAGSVVVATCARQRDLLVAEPYAVPAQRMVVVPQGDDMGRRFAAALPPGTAGSSPTVRTVPEVDDVDVLSVASGRRGPWCVDASPAV